MAIRYSFVFLVVLVTTAHLAAAQEVQLEGTVVDRANHEPLAFVNVSWGKPSRGTTTDIDGYFSLRIPSDVQKLGFSYVGYSQKHIEIADLRDDTASIVMLRQKPYSLQEVVVKPGKNPANRIIRRAYENRDENNPENVSAFTYRSYNKFVFNIDSVQRKISSDSLAGSPRADSSVIRLRKISERQHFMLMETVTRRKYMSPGHNKEEVLASRVSGFQDPSLSFIATQFQSFSFYNDFIELGNDRYLNPISKNSWKKYFFHLEDTLYAAGQDTVFVISYRPKRGKIFEALNGVMHIHTHGYALKTLIAEPWDPPGDLSVKIQQQYELIKGRQWFPHKLNTRLKFKNLLLAAGDKDYYLVGEGRTYIYDTHLNPELDKGDFGHVELSVPAGAYKRSESFWQNYRRLPLSDKDRRTYRIIDSLGRANRFDQQLETFQTLTRGYWPAGPVKIDLRKIIDYNKYEGLRLGLGLMTNDYVSDVFAVGGYVGYGFGDKELKYGGSLEVELDKESETTLHLSHINDVHETGGYHFLREPGFFSSEMYRGYLVESMDRLKRWQAALSFRTLDYLKIKAFIDRSTVKPFAEYTFDADDQTYQDAFQVAEAGVRLRYAYGEDFIRTHQGKFSMGTEAPVLYGNIIRGIDGLGGDFNYTKYEAAVSGEIQTRDLGRTHIRLEGGYSNGDLPAFNLYRGHGSFGSRLSIYSDNSFATMALDEFITDRFVSLFWTHNFRSLLWQSQYFNPHIKLVNNLGWGWMKGTGAHDGLEFRDYPRGYFETGLLLDRLLSTGFFHYGMGVFYRYGPYSSGKTADNLACKFSFRVAFN